MTDSQASGIAKCKPTPLEQAAMRLSEHCVPPARPNTGTATPPAEETLPAAVPATTCPKTGGPQ